MYLLSAIMLHLAHETVQLSTTLIMPNIVLTKSYFRTLQTVSFTDLSYEPDVISVIYIPELLVV